MAKKIKNDEENLQNDIDQELDDISLGNILAELGGDVDVKINIYRTGREYHGKQVFIASIHPDQFSLETLRDDYGGGDFRIHVRADGRLVANRQISVEKQPKKDDLGKLAEIITQRNESQNGFEKLAENIAQGFNQLGQMLIAMQQNQQPQIDPQMQMQNMLTMLATMKQIMDSGSKVDPMDGILKGIELAKEIIPREGEANAMDALVEGIKTFGKPIAEMAGLQLNHNPFLANQNMKGKIMPAGMPPKISPEMPIHKLPKNEDKMKTMLIEHQVNMLLKQAKRNADPGLYADLILDQLSDDQINEFLSKPNWFEEIVKINPEVNNYRSWFETVKNFVMEGLTMTDEDDINDNREQSNIVTTQIAGFKDSNEDNGDSPGNP